MNSFRAQATIECISTRKDKTFKVILGTQELSPEQKSDLFSVGEYGWFIFAPFETEEVEIPPVPQELSINKDRSPSKRLRNVIYRYYESIGGEKDDKKFNEFYLKQIETLIDRYKASIEV